MNAIPTKLPGVVILEPKRFDDGRGYFIETWSRERFENLGLAVDFIQDNESMSRRGVIRGLHYQRMPYAQAKLVRVVNGAIWDVVVDIRRDSATYGQYEAVELSAENKRQVFIPEGFAHGFAALRDHSVVAYKCDKPYSPAHERGIHVADPALDICWKLDESEWILSEKDRRNPSFQDAQPWDDA